MKKTRFVAYVSATLAMSALLSSCQLFTGYQQIEEADSADNWSGTIYPVAGETNIACLGTYHCEITRIDQTPIISAETHQPVDGNIVIVRPDKDKTSLVDNKSVKLVPLSASGISGLTNYYARVKPIKREVQVNFYPEDNLSYVERFTVIHEFVAGTYQLRAYKLQPEQKDSSLLSSASPNPLCIELIQDGNIERRFCKQADTERQGEFVETGLFDDTATS
ncbi:hypothetical protein ACS8E3_09895 [Psychrobacter sp. 2Y5]|uniref:hypothetical protein n=1 Tax=unclassified Psychrobacter TaxID=196806 RepID=UPI003F46C51A